MNIKILDSWLRDYLDTNATPQEIASSISLTSAGIERIEKWKDDFLYDVEITTNRPDMASVVGLAREAGAVLPQFGFKARFSPPELPAIVSQDESAKLTLHNDPSLVTRLCAVVLEVKQQASPEFITNRLESSVIRSLNNLIDITNYVMRTIGYPTHIFDYDRLTTRELTIRESKPGEEITTLDGKSYKLPGGDIMADDGTGKIVDLLGIMGLENSVVTDQTRRIVFFINNDNPQKIRKTSLTLGIRTEAAQLNEKELDPELVMDALQYGVSLFEKYASGRVVSKVYDVYPHKVKPKTVTVSEKLINRILGVKLSLKESAVILEKLGFGATITNDTIAASVPSFRAADISIPEDLVEEIARIYGYHTIPNSLPPTTSGSTNHLEDDPFFWENRTKQAMKYWGFTEVYTYPMVSEALYNGDTTRAVTLKNPLGEEFQYMRNTLTPSLVQVVDDNKKHTTLKLFEIGNSYEKQGTKLPLQRQHLAGIVKKPHASFYEVKGLIEQLAQDAGITALTWKPLTSTSLETEILLGKEILGKIEILDETLISFEINFELFTAHATLHRTFTPLQKYPPIVEDLSLIIDETILTGDIIDTVKSENPLIADVSLFDRYQNSRTFHIVYQSPRKNLTTEEVGEIREKILSTLKKKYQAKEK